VSETRSNQRLEFRRNAGDYVHISGNVAASIASEIVRVLGENGFKILSDRGKIRCDIDENYQAVLGKTEG
jgi:hypothetical protein